MKTLLVTGATGGIGYSICGLLQKKYKIFVIARDKSKVLSLCNEFADIAGYFICDLSKNDQIKRTIQEIADKAIKVDILVNNAGITNDSLFLRMDSDKWKNVIDTNLNSNFMLTSAISKK